MFEIGSSLRDARLRQGLDLARVEADTKIRGKYLQALEEERFEALPAETYVKGFLRTYAEYLGLDGRLYVDEFNSRFASGDEPLVVASAARRRTRATESNAVVVALAGIVAVTVLVVVAWQFGSPAGRPVDPAVGLAGTTSTTGTATTKPAATGRERAASPARPRVATLLLTAARGDCWMRVKTGSATGALLYEGTLEQGQQKRFVGKRIWIQLGAAGNLDVRLNGAVAAAFPERPAIVLVTARGVRTVSTL